MRSIIQWAVRSPSAMNLIMLASLLVGVIALVSLRREVFPNFQLEIIVVAVPYPGASPEEVEEAICQKVEAAIRSVDGIKTVTSVARESVGFAVVELTTSADVQRALADIRSEIDRIPSFPLLAEDPEIEQITFRTPAIRVGILAEPSDAADAELQLRAVAEEVRDDVAECGLDVEALASRPDQDRRGGSVHDQSCDRDGEHPPSEDLGRVAEPLDRLPDDPAAHGDERQAVDERREDLCPLQAEAPRRGRRAPRRGAAARTTPSCRARRSSERRRPRSTCPPAGPRRQSPSPTSGRGPSPSSGGRRGSSRPGGRRRGSPS